jgi:chromatin segregation and condensation protein Rec8/ScpA/Scc1 (kleisin family)
MKDVTSENTAVQKSSNDQQMEEGLIRTITLGSDWQEVLSTIVVEEGIDPKNVNIIKLADAFSVYLQRLKDFDFRIPARFILIAAILLSMKCESLLEREEQRLNKLEKDEMAKLNLDAPLLIAPLSRKPTRRVTLTELISAMNKAFEIKHRKELEFQKAEDLPEIRLPEPIVSIEKRIEAIYERIKSKGIVKFSELVPVWKRKDIINTFLPLLHLSNRGSVECEQEELFKEIYIKLK